MLTCICIYINSVTVVRIIFLIGAVEAWGDNFASGCCRSTTNIIIGSNKPVDKYLLNY